MSQSSPAPNTSGNPPQSAATAATLDAKDEQIRLLREEVALNHAVIQAFSLQIHVRDEEVWRLRDTIIRQQVNAHYQNNLARALYDENDRKERIIQGNNRKIHHLYQVIEGKDQEIMLRRAQLRELCPSGHYPSIPHSVRRLLKL